MIFLIVCALGALLAIVIHVWTAIGSAPRDPADYHADEIRRMRIAGYPESYIKSWCERTRLNYYPPGYEEGPIQ